MEYTIFNNIDYQGENNTMGKHKKNKKLKEEQNINKEKKVIEVSTGGVITIVVTIALSAIAATWIISERFSDLESDISVAQNDIVSMKEDISDLKNDVFNINSYLYGENGVDSQLETINSYLKISSITASNDMSQYINEASIYKNRKDLVTSPLNHDTIIGSDINGEECKANELVNTTVLLTYNEKNANGEDVEVYFLGQYSENYKWTGYCVTNAYYLDGTLYSICESNFDDGKRKDFKSIVYQPNNHDWLYSDRTIKEDKDNKQEKKINEGKNIHYLFDYNKEKNFTTSNVRTYDILYVDEFLKSVNSTITKYYSGDTSDGYFNDDSENAYRVTYYEDGTVESIYIGKFVDGYPNDDTGNAWEISYSENINSYEYNSNGIFEDDEYKGNSSVPIAADEANEIVSDYDFECELKWKN